LLVFEVKRIRFKSLKIERLKNKFLIERLKKKFKILK